MDRPSGASARPSLRTTGALFVCLALVATACGDTDEADATTSPPPATTVPAATETTDTPATTTAPRPAEPNPLAVVVEADTAAAVTAFVTAEGGTVTATAGDGTRFTLAIPAEALLGPQDVTLTPVASIDGLPLSGGLSAAADLAPEGLRLQQPATLTIELAGPAPAGTAVGFAYRGDGAEFHLYPTAIEDGAISVEVTHFSGYGAGAGTTEDIDDQVQRVPTAPGDQASQAVAAAMARSGGSPGQALSAAASSSVEDQLRQIWENDVRPRLDNALTDASQLDDAITTYLDWRDAIRMAVLTASFVDEDIEARDMLTFGIRNGIEELSQECLQQNAPENVTFITRWWLVANNLGLQIGYTAQLIIDIVRTCAEFVLQFDSSITLAAGPVSGTFAVAATVPLVLDQSLAYWTGSGPLTYSNVDFLLPPIPPNCAITQVQGTGDTFNVPFAWLNLDILAGPPDLRVVIDPGRPSESISATCTDPDSGQTFSDVIEFDGWVGNFALMHTNEFNIDQAGLESGIRISGFSSPDHMTFVKTYADQQTPAGVVIDEATTITVSPI